MGEGEGEDVTGEKERKDILANNMSGDEGEGDYVCLCSVLHSNAEAVESTKQVF